MQRWVIEKLDIFFGLMLKRKSEVPLKDLFPGFYSPTPQEYASLLDEATVVLDANVLLDLYRLPPAARTEFIAVLESLSEKLWIPYQVALEFQRNRLAVITNEKKKLEATLSDAERLAKDLLGTLSSLQLEKHETDVDAKEIENELSVAGEKLKAAVKKVQEAQQDSFDIDEIRDQIDKLLNGKVGVGPDHQEALDALVIGGDERFDKGIPPGFADAAKERDPKTAEYVHNGLSYKAKFGDLIIWRQIINHCIDQNVDSLIVVTSDSKSDWWRTEQGRTIGPHPELIAEIKGQGKVSNFWMYSLQQFVKQVSTQRTGSLSEKSVEEIVSIASEETLGDILSRSLRNEEYGDGNQGIYGFRQDHLLYDGIQPISRWFSRQGYEVERNFRGFPDIFAKAGSKVFGVEVKFVKTIERFTFPPYIVNAITRGYVEVSQARLDGFIMVVVLPDHNMDTIDRAGLVSKASNLMKKFPIDSIIFGQLINDEFLMVADAF